MFRQYLPKLTKDKTTLYIPIVLLLINSLTLFILDGPFWGLFIITFFIIICLIIVIRISTYLERYKINRIQEIAIGIILVSIILPCFILYMGFTTHIKAEVNKPELQTIVNELIQDVNTDEEKTLKLLEWFDYYSDNIFNNYQLSKQGVPGISFLNSGTFSIYLEPPYIGIRTFNDEDSLWVLTSRYGHCGEYGLIFRDMANASGLIARKVTCNGEDHVWNEILIDGEWKIVDSTAVYLPDRDGYDLSNDFMEKKVNRIHGNVSYVYAEYLNGTKVDITYRYTNLTNITISAIDEDGNDLHNIKIIVKSNNRYHKRNTGLNNDTNDNGSCTFTIGGGNYTFEALSNDIIPLYGEITDEFPENHSSHEATIILKSDWTKSQIWYYLVVILIISFIGIIYIVYKKRQA